MSGRAETAQLIRSLRKQGFTVDRTGSGHWKVFRTGGHGSVVLGFSPNHQGLQRSIKRLQGIGYDPEKRK